VYAVADCCPVTTIGLAEPVPVKLPGLDVTVYPVIAEPPVAGAVNAIEAEPLLYARPKPEFVAVGAEGVAGTVVAVMLEEAADAAPVAVVFVPVTAKV
jgi:hypothetical protein